MKKVKTTKVQWNLPDRTLNRVRRATRRRARTLKKQTEFGLQSQIATEALEIGLDALENE